MMKAIVALFVTVTLLVLHSDAAKRPDNVQLRPPAGYIPIRPCKGDPGCPADPFTFCSLDCLVVHANGTFRDCVQHFYNLDGTYHPHCWD